MTYYEPKKEIVDEMIADVQVVLEDNYIYPLDIPIALREVAKWCEDEAAKHDVANDFNGVPER